MQAWRAAPLGCLVAVLAGSLPASAQTLAGYVLDPQERRVAGAEVRLACDNDVRRTPTDREGRFAFDREPTSASCVLHVTASGFQPIAEPVGTGRRAPWVVRLAIEPIAETIEVRADASSARSPVGPVTFSRDELRTISDDPQEMVRYATARAGAGSDQAVYVDGLRSDRLPPASRIASIVVNADPFSVEFSDTAGRRIEIETTEPDRRWRPSLGAGPPILGARNPLAPGNRTRVRSFNGGLSGPLPWSNASFGMTAGIDSLDEEPAIVAVRPGDPNGANTLATTDRRSVSVELEQKLGELTRVRVEGARHSDRASAAGVGGEVLAEAGSSRHADAFDVRLTLTHAWPHAVWRNQLLRERWDQTTTATSGGIGIVIPGAFVAGGAPLLQSASGQSRWLWKTVVSSAQPSRPWRAGFTAERASGRVSQVPNPAGYAQLASPGEWQAALDGAGVANYYAIPTATAQRIELSGLAGFAETTVVARATTSLKGGMRVDWQSHDRVRVSPRVSWSARAGAWAFTSGLGLFTRDWRPEIFLGTTRADGTVPLQLLARQASLADIAEADAEGDPIRTSVGPGFARARYAMASESAGRRVGPLTASVEHTWWRGRQLAGARRFAALDGRGWVDWLESNRRSESHELRIRLDAGGPRRNISVGYGWLRARDDTDGAFSFPARQADLQAEWSRAARKPVHAVDVVASLDLPRAVRATAIVTLRGAVPYNVISAADAEGNGLQTDRAGLARNSGNGPASRNVSIYLSRRFNLSTVFGSRVRLPIDAGAQIDNALGARNWIAFGNVLGSPLFGKPEGALPGRSLRVWFALGR
jgi:hypothetical protein